MWIPFKDAWRVFYLFFLSSAENFSENQADRRVKEARHERGTDLVLGRIRQTGGEQQLAARQTREAKKKSPETGGECDTPT